jgi:DNA adenine methylase
MSATSIMSRPGHERELEFGRGFLAIRDPEANIDTHVPVDFSSIRARPFLKWAGGKQWLAPIASAIIQPGTTSRYFEPFLGGGALFFAAQPAHAVLSDLNAELICTYAALRDEVDPLIAELSRYPHDRDFFLAMRSKRPRSPVRTAARVIYLNKTAFNGMYRVNARGEFNVPFGSYRSPTICQEERLRDAAAALRCADLRCADFADATADAQAGDLVFFDPPYVTGHHNNGFRKYNAQIFSWHCQERLRDVTVELVRRGVRIAMTNADHPSLRALFAGMYVTPVRRQSLINSSAADRGPVREALYTSFHVSTQALLAAAESAE